MHSHFEDVPLFMTPEQLVHVTGEHIGSIARGLREGRIPTDKVNGRWRICRDVVFANARKGGRRRWLDRQLLARAGRPRRGRAQLQLRPSSAIPWLESRATVSRRTKPF